MWKFTNKWVASHGSTSFIGMTSMVEANVFLPCRDDIYPPGIKHGLPVISDFPNKPSVHGGFSIAMFDDTRGYLQVIIHLIVS